MTRRASLPGVDELFRSSKERGLEPEPDPEEVISPQIVKEIPLPEDVPVDPVQPSVPQATAAPASAAEEETDSGRRPRHEEKVTFYCTAGDLTRIERARLALRADHRVASDRGRIVRAALAEILDDFEANGPSSALVRRLKER